VAQELYQYQNKLVDYIYEAGLIDDTQRTAMLGANKDYIPFQRIMDDLTPGGSIGPNYRVRKGVREIKGSERQIKEPLDSVIRNTETMVTLAERNRAVQAFTDLAVAKGMAKPVRMMPGKMPAPDEYVVFYDGKRRLYKTAPQYAKIIQGLDVPQLSLTTRALSHPAKWLRTGVVLDPSYMTRNVVRDQTMAAVQSKHGYRPYWDFGKGLGKRLAASPEYREWMKAGGSQTALQSQDRDYIGRLSAQYGGPRSWTSRAKGAALQPIDWMRTVSETQDNATRIGEYMRARAGGLDPQAAAMAGRDVTQDFQRVGAAMRELTAITPFLTGQVQGVARGAESVAKRPVQTLSKAAALITLPAVALWLYNRKDPDYQALPDGVKDNNFLIPVGPDGSPGKFTKVPKPFEFGVVFGGGMERLLEKFANDNPRAFRNFEKSILDTIVPNMVPTVAVPVIEQFANRSIHFDTPIVPKRLETERPELRYSPGTSETAKLLGRGAVKIPGMETSNLASPAVIQNYIRGWTGALGDYATRGLDQLLKASGAVRPPPAGTTTGVSSLPLINKFVAGASRYAQPITDFYQDSEKLKMLARPGYEPDEHLRVKRSGDRVKDKEYQDRMLAHVDVVSKKMTDYNRELREIAGDMIMTAPQKQEKVMGIYKEMLAASQEGNRIIRHMKNQPWTVPFSTTVEKPAKKAKPRYGGPQ
jgi:hypothetical protein